MGNISKEEMRKSFDKVCQQYVDALIEKWELSKPDTWWIANDVGGVLAFNDTGFLSLNDLIFCIEEDVTIEEYYEWSEYNMFAQEFHQNLINLSSWHKGWHGLPKDAQDKLRSLRNDLDVAVKDYKKRY